MLLRNFARSQRDPEICPLPPGPRGPYFWMALRYAWEPYSALDAVRRFGDRYTVEAIDRSGPMVVFSSPDAIKDIFAADGEDLRSGEGMAPIFGPMLGWRSIMVLDGPPHARERRLLSPPFHGGRMSVYCDLIRDIAERVVDSWPAGRAFPVGHEMRAITTEVILRAVFGVDRDALFGPLRARIERFLAQANGPSAPFIAMPFFQKDLGRFSPWGRYLRNRQSIHDVLLAEIACRRDEGTDGRTDVLSLLVGARDDQGEPMSDEAILDEMLTLLLAGHETTATSLAWALWHLLRHPDAVAELRAEHARVTGGGPLGPAHVPQLAYLDAVIKESMRLTPVATMVVRRLHRPARIGGVDLEAGMSVGAAIYLTHRRPDLWPDPERFDPDRFLHARPSPYAFFPFGGGVRRCVGAAFATYEMKVVLATVLARVDLSVAPGYRMRPVLRAVNVAPSRGLPVVRRDQSR